MLWRRKRAPLRAAIFDAQIQDFRQDDLKISWLNVEGYDDWNGPVAFCEVHCTFKYCDTVQQMEILRQAAKKWNQLFVTDNPTIAAEKDTNRRQYLIVKTIYDFLAENTIYNTAAYEGFMNEGKTDWYAHTAYAAFFGLTGQGAADLDGTGYDWSVRQKKQPDGDRHRRPGQGRARATRRCFTTCAV